MATNKEAVKPLTPDIAGPNYNAPRVDFTKYVPWLRNFSLYQPPEDQKLLVREEKQ